MSESIPTEPAEINALRLKIFFELCRRSEGVQLLPETHAAENDGNDVCSGCREGVGMGMDEGRQTKGSLSVGSSL